jgi:hypothetical protein
LGLAIPEPVKMLMDRAVAILMGRYVFG